MIAAGIAPQIALVLFLAAFIGIVVWLWLVPTKRWNRDARLPIDDAPRAPEDAPPRPDNDASNDRSSAP